MPDYFDRLVAKSEPAGDQAGAAVRVRPRLPGPFERLDALGAALLVLDEESAVASRPAEAGPTVLPAPLPRPAAAPRPAPSESLLRPAVHEERTADPGALPPRRAPRLVAPTAGPVAAPIAEPVAREAVTVPAPVPAVTAPARPTAQAQPVPRPSVSVRPAVAPALSRPAPLAAAAQGAGGRRQQRPAERVVRVQIGRVEVRAAERAPAAPRRTPAARSKPAVGLEKYLERS